MNTDEKKEVILNNLSLSNQARLDKQNESIHLRNLFEYMDDRIPEKLYKYRECNEANLKTLLKKQIWVSNPNKWKDQADVTIPFDFEEDENHIKKNYNSIVFKYSFNIMNLLIEAYCGGMKLENVDLVKNVYLDYLEKEPEFNVDKLIVRFEEIIGWRDARKLSDLLSKKIKKFLNPKFEAKIINAIKSFLSINKLKDNVLMCSLSETFSNKKQWEDYANNGDGFCIEYTINPKNKRERKLVSYLLPILYEDKKAFSLIEWIEKSIETNGDKEKIDKLVLEFAEEAYLSLYTKEKCYSSEEEWRVRIDSKKISKGKPVKFDFATAIYLGDKINPDWEGKLLDIAKAQKLDVYRRVFYRTESKYRYIKII